MTTTGTGTRAPIDPRVQARRIAVRRDQGRRRLRRLAVAGVVTGLLATAWGLSRSPLLDVDRVVVRGTVRTSVDEARAASGIRLGRPMSDLDQARAERRLQALPWVEVATVRRRWPSTVQVTVRERSPVATVPARRGGWALVDAEGRVLAGLAEPPAGLPRLEGVPAAGPPGSDMPAAGSGLLRVAGSLPRSLRPRVRAVTAAGEAQLRLLLHPEGVVELGPPERLEEKLLAVATVLSEAESRGLAVLDVRVPSAPVLTRR